MKIGSIRNTAFQVLKYNKLNNNQNYVSVNNNSQSMQISNYPASNVAFTGRKDIWCIFKDKHGKIIQKFQDKLDRYVGQRNIVYIGCSETEPQNQKTLKEIEEIAYRLTARGYNSINGAGNQGVMGASTQGAYNSILQNHFEDYIGRSLSIVTQGGWGDEDLLRAWPITMARTGKETDRTYQFAKLLSNPHSAVICASPGATTMEELTQLIALNKYRDKGTKPSKIFLLGQEDFAPLLEMYSRMSKKGNFPYDPYNNEAEQLFEIVEPQDILGKFPHIQEAFSDEIRNLAKQYFNLPQDASQSQLAEAYNDFVKNANDDEMIKLYLHIKKVPGSKKDRAVEGKDLLQRVNSADGDFYHHAIQSGLYQIQQACRGLKMSWQE